MIVIRNGRWGNSYQKWFEYHRIWKRGWKWTPFVRMQRRKIEVDDYYIATHEFVMGIERAHIAAGESKLRFP